MLQNGVVRVRVYVCVLRVFVAGVSGSGCASQWSVGGEGGSSFVDNQELC